MYILEFLWSAFYISFRTLFKIRMNSCLSNYLSGLFRLYATWGQGLCLLYCFSSFHILLFSEQKDVADSPWPTSSHISRPCLHLGWLLWTSILNPSALDATSRKPCPACMMEASPLIPWCEYRKKGIKEKTGQEGRRLPTGKSDYSYSVENEKPI